MKIQIYSDLHLDINREVPFNLPDDNTFTVLCGDISGYMNDTLDWIAANVNHGVFVEGNHIGYDNKKHSVQYLQKQLEYHFPIDADVSYLYDNYKVIGDYVFVGGILWTDYKLNGEGFYFYNKQVAHSYMNDFNYDYYNINGSNIENEKRIDIKKMIPSNCETMFYKTKNAIKEACEKFPDKKIIVVTHHAPHPKSIPPIYETHKASASYASDLSEFILDHPNIKLWCHGHIHSNSDYMIGDCRVVCNPRGYERFTENRQFNSHYVIEI